MNAHINSNFNEKSLSLSISINESEANPGSHLILSKYDKSNNMQIFILGNDKIIFEKTKYVVDSHGGDGKEVTIEKYNGSPSQTWYYFPDGTIRDKNNQCLALERPKASEGVKIIAQKLNPSLLRSQSWTVVTRK